jgi:Zn-dependent protease with chaperone function
MISQERENVFLYPSETTILVIISIIISFFIIYLRLQFLLDSLIVLAKFLFNYDFFIYRSWDTPSNSVLHEMVHNLVFFFIIITLIIIYFFKPLFIIKWYKFNDLKEQDPDLHLKIIDYARSINIQKTFGILYNASDDVDIFTICSPLRKYMIISRGFLNKFQTKENEFKAIIYHEMGHIANDDGSKFEISYLSLSFCISLILFSFFLFFLNFLYLIFHTGEFLIIGSDLFGPLTIYFIEYSAFFIYFFITLISLNYLLYRILRLRELYADAFVLRYIDDEYSLLNSLVRWEMIPYITNRKLAFHSLYKNFDLFKSHPSFKVRKEYINNPIKFFELNKSLAFIVGYFSFAIFASIPTPFYGIFGVSSDITKEPAFALMICIIIAFFCYSIILLNYLPYLKFGRSKLKYISNPILTLVLWLMSGLVICGILMDSFNIVLVEILRIISFPIDTITSRWVVLPSSFYPLLSGSILLAIFIGMIVGSLLWLSKWFIPRVPGDVSTHDKVKKREK